MKIEKLPSGSYRIRKMYKGTTYTVITEYKPTQKEALQLLAAEMDKVQTRKTHMTFREASDKYIEVKENVLSPSTITGYRGIQRRISESFSKMNLNDITPIDVQKEINDYSSGHSPKTVRNINGFISAVLGMFRPDVKISTTLPQKIKSEPYVPSDSDIKKILEYAKGTAYEIPIILATFGLRRSEICALSLDDLNGNILTINKALVQNDSNEYVIKSTKTTDSAREIYLPDYVVKLINEKGCIYKGYPGQILKFLNRAQTALNIPHFRLHALRHYYASMSHAMGIPDSYIMAAGGWKSDNVLKSVYRHALDDRKLQMQQQAAEYILSQILS